MFLIILWTIALLIAFLVYCRNPSARLLKRGVKAEGLLSTLTSVLRIFMGREHSVDSLSNVYFKYRDERLDKIIDASPGSIRSAVASKSWPENRPLEAIGRVVKRSKNFTVIRFVGGWLFGAPMVQVHDIELIKRITIKDYEHFIDHRNLAAGDPLFDRNLFTLKGDEWKDMRSNLSPAFTSSKIRLMVPLMVEVGDQMMLNLKKNIKESGSEYLEVRCKDLTTRYANDVIATCAFGLKVDSHSDRNNEFYIQGLQTVTFGLRQVLLFTFSAVFPWLSKAFGLRLFSEKTHNFFANLVLSNIENREKNNIIRPDMIHLLMEAKKGKLVYEEQTQDNDAGFATVEESSVGKRKIHKEWKDIDLIAQAVIFFLAGFETVATAMSFLLYELALNQDIQDRLVKEIKETNTKNGGKFDYNCIQEMTYMDMVVSEVLRKWPPGGALDRSCVKDYNMGKPNDKATEDFIIHKGEGLAIPVWPIHRDPDYFPDPLRFDPERFSDENKHKIKPFTYLPFGLGPRNCIGSRFALCEVKVMAYQLLQHLEVSPGPRTPITTQLDPRQFNASIKGGDWVRFRIRPE